MADSEDIFLYLNDLYAGLPERDQLRFGETWRAYEQTYAEKWMKLFERRLGIHIDDVPLYGDQRWLQHTFDSSTAIARAAQYRSNQDVSKGINLSVFYLIRFSVDGGPQIEVDLRGANPLAVTADEIVTKINAAAGFSFATLVVLGALVNFKSATTGPTSNITFYPASQPTHDASGVILGLDPMDLPKSFPEFPFEFLLGDSMIVGIPLLQDKIHDELTTVNLVSGPDYAIEFGTGVIAFKELPPSPLWAKDSFVNLETPYNNFGYLMDIYDANTPAYLKSVKGLWFAFWTGPRPENIRRSLYLLFGLPAASQSGVVVSVSNLEIVLKYADNSTETFAVPADLFPIVSEGDAVTRFQPLVTGIIVLDKVNSPGFLEREVGRAGVQEFLTEKASRGTGPDTDETKALKTVEQNTYLPQISVNAFISPNINLANVKSFLHNIQPKSRTFLFQVLVGTFRDEIDLLEFVGLDVDLNVTPNVDSNPNTFAQQSDLDDAEVNDDTGIILDSDGYTLGEQVGVDVFNGVTLVDSFLLTG